MADKKICDKEYKHESHNIIYLLLAIIIDIIILLSFLTLAENNYNQFVDFENESDFEYFFPGDGDSPEFQKGCGGSLKSLKLAGANCASSRWTCTNVRGVGSLRFMWTNEPDFASKFELIVSLDGKQNESLDCNSLGNWRVSDPIIRVYDDKIHKLILEYKYKDSSLRKCSPIFPCSTAWIDNITTTGSLKVIKMSNCPKLIRKDDTIAEMMDKLSSCMEVEIEAGTNLQGVLNNAEAIRRKGDISEKILILQEGEYRGQLTVLNLSRVTIRAKEEGNVVFSGYNTSIEIINSSEIVICGLSFGKSEGSGLLLKDSIMCRLENNNVINFNSSGIKIVNSDYNEIYKNKIKSRRGFVDGLYLRYSSFNNIKNNVIDVDNYIYIFKNDSNYNNIVHIDNGKGRSIKDHNLIFGVDEGLFKRIDGTEFNPNRESLNRWDVA